METDDVAAMRAIYDAFNRRNFDDLAQLLDPDVLFEVAESDQETRGRERMLDYLSSWWGAWETVHWHVDEVREEGGRVLTVCTIRGRPRGTNTDVERRMAHITRFREGRMLHTRSYVHVDRAESDFEQGL